jgi:D-alanyl-D-alanine carboxypeptidase
MHVRHAVASLMFVAGTSVCHAQDGNKPAAQQFRAWMAVFNGGDRDSLVAFLKQDFPSRAEAAGREVALRDMTGGFDLRRIQESTPTEVVALVQERLSDQFAQVTMDVEPAVTHHITNLKLMAVPRPPGFALPHMSATELTTALRRKLDQDVAADGFAGAVLVAAAGTPMFEQAYGLADREHKTPNTLDTRFRMGSMNKMFTATAIMQLVQAGKVGLSDPLGKYLPDYPNKDVATKVTIAQLLTHTGGTGDIFGPEFDARRLQLRTLQDYITLYGNRAPEFKPGSKWEYSNYGFILLGRVIETVSGESYYDYVRDHIFRPAGMMSTGSEPEDQHPENLNVGYTTMGDSGLRPNTETLPYRGTSAGGGYTTVGDLFRFAEALQHGTVLNAHYVKLMTTGKVDAGMGRYAYGFGDRTMNGTRCYGHSGGAPGMNGDLDVCPGPGYVVAVLSNMDPPAASRISDFVTNRLPAR